LGLNVINDSLRGPAQKPATLRIEGGNMKNAIWVILLFLGGLLFPSPGAAIGPYQAPIKDVLAIKNIVDDPAPFYTDSQYYKIFIPDEVWEKITHDPEASRAAWEKAVGLRAKDLVGQIAPEIKPGKYALSDKEKYPFKDLMTPYHYDRFNAPGTEGQPNHIGHFTEFEVIPTQQVFHSLPLAEATLQNMGKTKQDEEGYIVPESFEGGYPFPRPSGPHKAMQIIYNWEKRRRDTESTVNYDLTLGVNSACKVDHRGTATFHYLRTQGRVVIPPYGWYDERARSNDEEMVQLYTLFSPRDLYGNVYYGILYTDPRKDLNFLAYVNFLRRIRKLSSTDTQDQAVGQDLAFDDSEGLTQRLNPDRYPYKFRVVEEREFLMPAYTTDASDYLDSNDGWKWKGLRFERRPVWVVEMDQQDPNYLYSRRIAYFDKESLLPLLWEYYDQKGRYYRTYEILWGLVVPMGYYNSIHVNNCDWLDVHCTWGFNPAYPALWLSRQEVSLRNMMRQK
jgi:hypothetical protein